MDLRIPMESIRQRAVATAVVAGLSVAALTGCGDKSPGLDPSAMPSGTEAPADGEPDASTTGDTFVKNALNPSTEELQHFDCVEDGKNSYGTITVTKLHGVELVEQILPNNMGTDINATDRLHRKWTDALSSPFLGDLSDPQAAEGYEQQLKLSFCAEPVLLGAFVHDILNSRVENDRLIKNSNDLPEILEQFKGLTDDQIVQKLANPFNADDVTKAQEKENIAATLNRQEVAKWAAAVLNGAQNLGVVENVPLSNGYGLEKETAFDPLGIPALKKRPVYEGSALVFDLTEKVDGICEPLEFSLAFNAGRSVPNGQGGDKSPVDLKVTPDCEPTPAIPAPENPGTPEVPGDSTPGKHDDGTITETGTDADTDRTSGDAIGAGQGNSGQNADPTTGTIVSETLPPAQTQATAETTPDEQPVDTTPASTSPAPTSTNAPVVAPGNAAPSEPEAGALPVAP